ncbi:hypothetical protein CC1G_02980 [Coprinopsis cinerea okayama7|uniref:Uncharacterized protein n=1 Tax=Coprinopsis cinerea (strain Okayama-7 / 130 / ATCC MYA-4618 / FGSC 9003) TaxID=240176 RepID=A8NRZ0_COPC7|nr:hypothetical protein CC1G_02980 [Coprinopsis cinerea okayama7\|eukprot:XP_001835892.2 hypothetical protein CC1G_02980 [Coprinopsis cinerea okayama7\
MQRSPSPIPVDEEDYEEGELQAMYDKAMTDAQQDVGEGDSGSQSPNSYHLCILCRPPGSLPPLAPSSFCSNPEGVPILSQSRFFTLSVPKGLKKQFAPPAVMDLAQSTPSETATLASATPDPQVTGTDIEGDNVGSQVVESKADQPTGMVASPVSPTEPTSPSPPSQPLPSLLMSPKLPPDTVAQNTKDEVHKATHLTPDPNPFPDISSLSTKHPLINLATLNANSPKKPNKTAKLLKRLIDEYRSPSVGSRQGTVDAKPTATTESHSEQSDPPTPLCSPPKVSTERMENDVPTSESSSSVATSEPRQKAKPGPVLQASPAKSADLHRRDSEPEIEEVELLVQPPSSDSDSSPQHPIKCDTTPKASPENDNGAQADLQQGESTGSTSSISASSSTINNTDAGSSGTGSSSEDTQDDSPAPATPPTTGEFKLLNFDLRHFFGLSPSLFKSGDSRRSLDSSGDTNDVDMNVLELELEYPDPSS